MPVEPDEPWRALSEACRGVGQIISTANDRAWARAPSPTRIEPDGASEPLRRPRATPAVRRILYVSAHRIRQDSPVDIFRIKWYVEDAIRRQRPALRDPAPDASAFMDVWGGSDHCRPDSQEGCRTNLRARTAQANSRGRTKRPSWRSSIVAKVINEKSVEIGGPSTAMSMNDVTNMSSRSSSDAEAGASHIPVFALTLLPPVVRLFDEVAASPDDAWLFRDAGERAASKAGGGRPIGFGAPSARASRRIFHDRSLWHVEAHRASTDEEARCYRRLTILMIATMVGILTRAS